MKSRLASMLVIVVIVCTVFCLPVDKDITVGLKKISDVTTVVIDPGHGGIDGGAESSSGTAEKDINLAIGMLLKELLEKEGIQVVMTREDDKGLYNENTEAAIRSLKTEDMKARKQIIDEAGADLAVSIHLNSFTQDTSVNGAQVFYPTYGDTENLKKSEAAAKVIQSELNQNINTIKDRTELGKDDVFILKNITCPIVIVECGFLSNPQEAALLNKNTHQGKIAKSLKASICRYLEKQDH